MPQKYCSKRSACYTFWEGLGKGFVMQFELGCISTMPALMQKAF